MDPPVFVPEAFTLPITVPFLRSVTVTVLPAPGATDSRAPHGLAAWMLPAAGTGNLLMSVVPLGIAPSFSRR